MSDNLGRWYKVLGVDKNASEEEIKKAFQNLAKIHHPDRSNSPNATRRFQDINKAYQVALREKEAERKRIDENARKEEITKASLSELEKLRSNQRKNANIQEPFEFFYDYEDPETMVFAIAATAAGAALLYGVYKLFFNKERTDK